MAGAKQIGQVASEKGSKILGSLGGTTSTLFFGINAFTTLQDYKQARQEGNGIIGSAASAGLNYVKYSTLGWTALGVDLAGAVPGMAVGAVEGISKKQRNMNRQARRIPFNNSTFNDNQRAFTMRQAGMQLAKNSQYNLQQSLMGNEANYLR